MSRAARKALPLIEQALPPELPHRRNSKVLVAMTVDEREALERLAAEMQTSPSTYLYGLLKAALRRLPAD